MERHHTRLDHNSAINYTIVDQDWQSLGYCTRRKQHALSDLPLASFAPIIPTTLAKDCRCHPPPPSPPATPTSSPATAPAARSSTSHSPGGHAEALFHSAALNDSHVNRRLLSSDS